MGLGLGLGLGLGVGLDEASTARELVADLCSDHERFHSPTCLCAFSPGGRMMGRIWVGLGRGL